MRLLFILAALCFSQTALLSQEDPLPVEVSEPLPVDSPEPPPSPPLAVDNGCGQSASATSSVTVASVIRDAVVIAATREARRPVRTVFSNVRERVRSWRPFARRMGGC